MNSYINEIGSVQRETLIIGTYPTIAQELIVDGEAEFLRGDVVVKAPGGSVALADASAAGGPVPYMGIICDDFTVAAGETAVTAMYVKGVFNRRALRFAAGTTADDLRDDMAAIGLIVRETRV